MPRLSATLEELDFEIRSWLIHEYRDKLVYYQRALCSYTDALRIEFPTILMRELLRG